jgi:S1-C subfamily serine protease
MKYKTLLASVGILSIAAGIAVGYQGCEQSPCPKAKKGISASVIKKENYFSVESVENAYQSSLRVEATKDLEEKCANEAQEISIGSGVLLSDLQTGDHYIFSVEHVVPAEIDCKNPVKKIKVVKSTVTTETIKAELVKKYGTVDLSLFKLEQRIEGKIPFHGKVAKTLYPGDYVLGIGFPNGSKKYFISSVESTGTITTYLDMLVVGGNSGGGVFKINNEALELAGIVKSFPAGITSLEKIREFLQGTPLEDDYL